MQLGSVAEISNKSNCIQFKGIIDILNFYF